MAALDVRLRIASPELLTLPWLEPLADWDATVVPIRDVPVGASRHLVRFVEADGALWALKQLPVRVARREFDVLLALEQASLPAVRPGGVVVQPFEDTAVLVTRYLDGSWQYRRLLMRVPFSKRKHRARLFDAMAALLVDLHRGGVFWGDGSLANTLFRRDGQLLYAWMVDAETSEVHPALTDGQRATDLGIFVENTTGGLLDLAARLDAPADTFDQIVEEGEGIRSRYADLWAVLHEETTVRIGDRHAIEHRLRRLHELGFAVDEVRLVAESPGSPDVRLQFAVADRGFHRRELQAQTGLEVGEGQARILLSDLQTYRAHLQRSHPRLTEGAATDRWLREVLRPGMRAAHDAVGGVGDPIQAYCDLLEVRWLLSEAAGRDVGDRPALDALRAGVVPAESAAELVVADQETAEHPVVDPDALLD